MKLSEKLAALEAEEGGDAPEEEPKAPERSAAPSRESAPVATDRGDDDAAASDGPRRSSTTRDRPAVDTAWIEKKRKVRALIMEELAPRMSGLSSEELKTEVKETLDELLQRDDIQVSPLERRRLSSEMISDILGYGPLDAILGDPNITEVMCNAYNDIWIEQSGRLTLSDVAFTDDTQYRQVIDKIVSAVGRRVDESSPMCDARLPDGSRVNVIIPPLALKGAALTIRKFAEDPYQAKDLINFGTWTTDLVTVLEACVRGKLNVVVSGGTGTGKTTNLNVLSSFIPDGERLVTIEDSAELQLQQPHVVTLETRPPNAEGAGHVSMQDLVKNALRMRPDRIIVGECRGGEALDMLQAMNTGHEGSMTTVHANNAREAVSRLETLVLMAGYELPMKAIRDQINAAIDIILQVTRMPDGRRVINSLTELQGMEGETILMQDIFHYRHLAPREDGTKQGELVPTGLRPKFAEHLKEEGVELPASAFKAPAPVAQQQTGKRRGSVRAPNKREIADKERLR